MLRGLTARSLGVAATLVILHALACGRGGSAFNPGGQTEPLLGLWHVTFEDWVAPSDWLFLSDSLVFSGLSYGGQVSHEGTFSREGDLIDLNLQGSEHIFSTIRVTAAEIFAPVLVRTEGPSPSAGPLRDWSGVWEFDYRADYPYRVQTMFVRLSLGADGSFDLSGYDSEDGDRQEQGTFSASGTSSIQLQYSNGNTKTLRLVDGALAWTSPGRKVAGDYGVASIVVNVLDRDGQERRCNDSDRLKLQVKDSKGRVRDLMVDCRVLRVVLPAGASKALGNVSGQNCRPDVEQAFDVGAGQVGEVTLTISLGCP